MRIERCLYLCSVIVCRGVWMDWINGVAMMENRIFTDIAFFLSRFASSIARSVATLKMCMRVVCLLFFITSDE